MHMCVVLCACAMLSLLVYAFACLSLSFSVCVRACVRAHLRLDVHVATTCSAFLWHEAQCCHWAAMPSALAYWARRPNSPSAKCMWELPTVWCHFCFVELFPKQFLTVQSYIVAERIKKQYNRKGKKKEAQNIWTIRNKCFKPQTRDKAGAVWSLTWHQNVIN